MLHIEGINRSEFVLYFYLVKSIKGFFRVRVQQKN